MTRKVLSFGCFGCLGVILLLSFLVLLRFFIVEPYSIPSHSMTPTLVQGDHIIVNKLSYRSQEPQRGDVVVFRKPDDDVHFVKRIIGVPGDEIKEVDGILSVNGETVKTVDYTIKSSDLQNKCIAVLDEGSQSVVPKEFLPLPYFRKFKSFQQKIEYLPDDKPHLMQLHKTSHITMDFTATVSEGQYFMMGDSRDESQDSRFWGFVPRENITGKATYIWLSFNADRIPCADQKSNWGGLSYVRWDRFGRKVW
jgi:signal peptidase I